MKASPTQRSLEWCRKQLWPCQVVEKWIPQARKRVDLFGCIDIVVLDGQPGVLGIQATSATNHAARVKKAMDQSDLRAWLKAGNRFVVQSWRKDAKTGRWQVRIEAICLNGLPISSP